MVSPIRSRATTPIALEEDADDRFPSAELPLSSTRSGQEQRFLQQHGRSGFDRILNASNPHVFSQSANSPVIEPVKSKKQLFAEWDTWARTSVHPMEKRDVAVSRMKAWVNNDQPDSILLLCGLDLIRLPENFPSNLKTLDVTHNQLISLPAHLPTGLNTVYACVNQLASLPETLPASITALDVANNRLTRLPENLPASLQFLHVKNNELSRLPENMPSGLISYQGEYNPLTSLPENFPASLREIYVFSNRLNSVPQNLPLNLNVLDIRDNPVASVPENILTLPSTCSIYLNATYLSEAVRNRLDLAMNVPGYNNVFISFNMAERNSIAVQTLQEEVSEWAQEAGNTALIDWSGFEVQPYATQFAQFLNRLRETSEYLNVNTRPDFQQRIVSLLGQLQNDLELQGMCFNIARDAVDTCGDRVALRLLNMETVCLDSRMEADIKLGKFDRTPQVVMDYCKAQYRQKILADAASEKIKVLNFCDEIEVILGFIVVFSREFQLNAQMNTLLYGACSNVSPEDVISIRKKLTNRPFTEDTKNLYRPFFEKFKHGNPTPIDRLNAMPADQNRPSTLEQDKSDFLQFLANAPALTLLLKKKYPEDFVVAQALITQRIEQEQNEIRLQLDQLSPENPLADRAYRQLHQRFRDIPEEVTTQTMFTLLQRFFLENSINATMD